ncbi:MAG TPA: pitrilysin family protein [Mycobacteriales bacterium]|nr:pitrilysin family protein [Mycobacteriales bacterium]
MSPARTRAGKDPVRQALSSRPELGAPARIKAPSVATRTLPNGLRLAAVRRPGVPLVEVRLRLPFAGTAPSHLARTSLLTETLFAGTERHDARSLAEIIQALGGALSAGADADRLAVTGSALASNLRPLLDLLAQVLTGATYPAQEVAGERDRIAEEIAIARTTPSTLAGEAVSRRMFGGHAYGRDLPTVEEIRSVTAATLRSLHAHRVAPTGALLVMVGDVAPARALDAAEAALGGWSALGRKPVELPAVPAFVPGGIALVDRPGSVQTSIRICAPGPRRTDDDYAALMLANTVFAGYFSSRLVANIREDKGYTYSPHAGVSHARLASMLTVDADVATDVTAPALVETRYEMARVAALPITQPELDAARRYLVGTLALATSSQAGLASTLTTLLEDGVDGGWLKTYPALLATVDLDAAYRAARRWLAPARTATVLVGDASVIGESVQALDTVTPLIL